MGNQLILLWEMVFISRHYHLAMAFTPEEKGQGTKCGGTGTPFSRNGE